MSGHFLNKCFKRSILLAIVVASFLILPLSVQAKDISDISSEEISQHLQMSSKKSEVLMHTLIQVLTDEMIEQYSSPDSSAKERAVPMILKKGVQVEALNYLLIDAPVKVGYKIVTEGVDLARIAFASDVSVFLKRLEKKSVEKAVETGEEWLFRRRIRTTPGTIKVEYKDRERNKQTALFQYILIYKPASQDKGKLAVRVYSSEFMTPPRSRGAVGMGVGTFNSLKEPLPPFTVTINGTVEKVSYGAYNWVKQPDIEIKFPEHVPDLGFESLGFWERNLVRPLKSRFRKIEVIVAQMRNAPKEKNQGENPFKKGLMKAGRNIEQWANSAANTASKAWSGVKTGLSKINPFGAHLAGTGSEDKTLSEADYRDYKPAIAEGDKTGNQEPRIRSQDKEEQRSQVAQNQEEDTFDDKQQEQDKSKTQKEEQKEKEQQQQERSCIALNKASKKDLQQITGVGPVTAGKIDDFRKSNQFYSINDLAEISGVGSVTVADIKKEGLACVKIDQAEPKQEEQEEQQQPQEEQQKQPDQKEEQTELCKSGASPAHSPVIINEIAWMGTQESYANEWIELKNTSNREVSLKNWQLLDKDQDITVVFQSGKVAPGNFYLLERTDQQTLPEVEADRTYTGGLSNSEESLSLFNPECELVDEVVADPDWEQGDNDSKKTMERSDLQWQTSRYSGGTPKEENSSGAVTYSGGGGGGASSDEGGTAPPSASKTYPKVLVSEIQIDPIQQRFVELFNPNDSEVNLTDWYLQRKTATRDSWGSFVTKTDFKNKAIPTHGYLLIARSSPSNPEILVKDLTLTKDNSIALKNPKGEIADLAGWGQAQDSESAPFPKNPEVRDLFEEYLEERGIDYSEVEREGSHTIVYQSLGRKVTSESDCQDTDNNAEDFEIQTPTPRAENKTFTEPKLEEILGNISETSFNYNPSNPKVNQTVTFNADPGTALQGNETYHWDFGDGTATSVIKVTTTHSYTATGSYPVSLLVSDEQGSTSSTSSIVEVKSTGSSSTAATGGVVINEIMYNLDSSDAGREWLEVFNGTHSEINLVDWRLYEDETNHYIQGSSTIPGESYAVVADDSQQFLEDHPDYDGVLFDSAFSLENSTGSLALKNQGSVVDEITYTSEWGADGNGDSLQKATTTWKEAPPTPGRENSFPVNKSPSSSFTFFPAEPKVGEQVTFDASSSSDPDGEIVEYQWDFGSQSTTSVNATVTHVYSKAGTTTVALTVVDEQGATSSTSTLLQVNSTSDQSDYNQASTLIVNEVAWMGTDHSGSDEWMEFYNASDSEVNIANWSIFGADTGECLNFADADNSSTTVVAPGDYLIYANHQNDVQNSSGESLVDVWDATIGLNNSSPGQLILYNATGCSTGTGKIVDTVNQEKDWLAGDNEEKATMERMNYRQDGTNPSNWEDNNQVVINGRDAGGNEILGTPGRENSILHVSSSEGTEEDPYQIYDLTGLQAINNNLDAWYELTTDINASSTAEWNNGLGFESIGDFGNANDIEPFTGHFDGNHHVITNLHIDRSERGERPDGVGLFGVIRNPGVVESIGVTEANVSGRRNTGIVAGYNAGTISKSYSTGVVQADDRQGGLVGELDGVVKDSYSLAEATEGLVGRALGTSTIANSYFTGDNGALVGEVYLNRVNCTSSFWDAQRTDRREGCGVSKWTSGLKRKKTFTEAGWDFETIWGISTGTYPYLKQSSWTPSPKEFEDRGRGTEQDPYLVSDVEELQDVSIEKNAHYSLQQDIDASATASWNDENGFEPIGYYRNAFQGTFNGNDHVVSNLFIDRTGEDKKSEPAGLFGWIGLMGIVKNLGVVEANVTADRNTGVLAGYSEGVVSQCFSTGAATGTHAVGGLIGHLYDTQVRNSYSHVSVSGMSMTGGLAGRGFGKSFITNSYSVSNNRLLGEDDDRTICQNSFWDAQRADQGKECGIPKSTSELKQKETFTGWDFETIWSISTGTYPYLQ